MSRQEEEDEKEFNRILSVSQYDEPPIFGRLQFNVKSPVASVQSSKEKLKIFQSAIRAQTAQYKYLLSGDVRLEITCFLDKEKRHESDASADLDNILKPMLDSLAGPEGILIDDSQIRSLGIKWLSSSSSDDFVDLDFEFLDSDYIPKDGLVFVNLDRALYLPVNTGLPRADQRIYWLLMLCLFRGAKVLKQLTGNYNISHGAMMAQRKFHRTRLKGFTVLSRRDYGKYLRGGPLPVAPAKK
ncbi:RusA family crossover junction endodeoxyribonuclease [Corallococcus sp. CA049B]|uniref:RusA family crossover junction endodeoxyribonuclease n=1 Tax=Corallococcus sp. CA049B TaxID=2316730 RepID=UPI00131577A1|nr:RusA family crossover junction endodeoxyribonuclease [Corallococcus sp. CA049B]